MKHYSKVLGEYVFIGKNNTEGLVNYSHKEIENIKTLRRVLKSDKDFAESVRLLHMLKLGLNAEIKDWDIPWPDQEKNQMKKEKPTRSFWTQQQQDYSKNISEKIKSLTKVQKSTKRLENLLKYQGEHKYK